MQATLVSNLKTQMKQKGWKAAALSREAGLNEYTVQNILRGQSKQPGVDKIEALARALGITTEQLLYGTETSSDKPDFVQSKEWDGILYCSCMNMITSVAKKKSIIIGNNEEEYKTNLLELTRQAYIFAQKKGSSKPDEVFIEVILERGA